MNVLIHNLVIHMQSLMLKKKVLEVVSYYINEARLHFILETEKGMPQEVLEESLVSWMVGGWGHQMSVCAALELLEKKITTKQQQKNLTHLSTL